MVLEDPFSAPSFFIHHPSTHISTRPYSFLPVQMTIFAEGRSDTEEQVEGEAARPTYIHHHIKQFQVRANKVTLCTGSVKRNDLIKRNNLIKGNDLIKRNDLIKHNDLISRVLTLYSKRVICLCRYIV